MKRFFCSFLLAIVSIAWLTIDVHAEVTKTRREASDGFVWIQLKEGSLQGAESVEGKPLIPIKYSLVVYQTTNGGWFNVKDEYNKFFGVYTKEGECLVEPTYYDNCFLRRVDDGFYIVVHKDEKYGILDGQGNEIVPPAYNTIVIYSGGVFKYKGDDGKFYSLGIKLAGNTSYKVGEAPAPSYAGGGSQSYSSAGQSQGASQNSDNFVRERKTGSDGFEWVLTKNGSLRGAETVDGVTIVPPNYGMIVYQTTSGGWFGIHDLHYKTEGVYTKDGRCVIPTGIYDGCSVHKTSGDGILWVKVEKNNKKGAVDWNGKEIIAPQYDKLYYLSKGFSYETPSGEDIYLNIYLTPEQYSQSASQGSSQGVRNASASSQSASSHTNGKKMVSVKLKSGVSFVGELVSLNPLSEVVINVAGVESRIPMSEVESIDERVSSSSNIEGGSQR